MRFQTNHGAFLCSRREFVKAGVASACAVPLAGFAAAEPPAPALARSAKVAISPCKTYDLKEIKAAFAKGFDCLGGLGKLVVHKTVTIKINLTGTSFVKYLGRPVGETYMTHPQTALALAGLLFEAGARRVRLVESTTSRADLETTLKLADWPLQDFAALGKMEYENTRNLGQGARYATLKVPSGGYMFSSFDLNHAYADTDVMVSLCKMKNHVTVGATLSLKNMFGVTPNSRYGEEAGREDAVAGRGQLHCPSGELLKLPLPGFKGKHADYPMDGGYRVPRTIADICGARPVDLAIIDGITSIEGGEGYWCEEVNPVRVKTPGVLVMGLNPVSTDAVGLAVMGYADPRATKGTPPFNLSDNHILLAEQAGLGTADLKQIEILGQPLAQSICPFHLSFPKGWRP